MKSKFVIGVLGGMGTYATIHLFQRYAEIFPANKEWDRPRIIIDNNCTMPSRVRAFLYNENADLLVKQMTDSIYNLIQAGATRIILACNTSHLFLKKIYEILPEAQKYVVNIIDNCVEQLNFRGISEVYLLASEGTILSKIYHDKFEENRIKCFSTSKENFVILRECIEAVKQNKYSNHVKEKFLKIINDDKLIEGRGVILGCTELPILYEMYQEFIKKSVVYDPLFMALEKLKLEYDSL